MTGPSQQPATISYFPETNYIRFDQSSPQQLFGEQMKYYFRVLIGTCLFRICYSNEAV